MALMAFFPRGIDRDTLDFHLGDDFNNYLYMVENTSQIRREQSLLKLYDGANVHGGSIAEIQKQIRPTEPGSLVVETQIAVKDPTTQRWSLIIMERRSLFAFTRFLFSLIIGFRVEDFEWRPSQGSEVRSVHPHPHAHGYKLVRVNRRSGRGGQRATRQHGESSDGKEIVAVWATFETRHKKRPFTFQLRGSGATGELGAEFPLAALMTALKIYSSNDPLMNVPRRSRVGI
ncbi:hypothetical protein F4818DRAFT_240267 [Hypoxylon cercidicola]|nr:hypothetical protein F4818DRAFT_240267 [Hypoxylon cercidicola]